MTVSRRGRRSAAAVFACVLALVLAGCATPLPDSIAAGSAATVGWTGRLTGTNTASVDGATAGNLDVAALTRGQFAENVDGAAVIDESFGTATVTNPETFTVRYDLAEPTWSDGIPVDAADLMLAWAAGSNAVVPPETEEDVDEENEDEAEPPFTFESVTTGLTVSEQISDYDQFDRWIEIRFDHPVVDWQTALDVAVPAHVVGQLAFDLEDPMEAKQAVLAAIEDRDTDAMAAIAEVWNTGFTLPEGDGSNIPENLLLSNGPYQISQVDQRNTDAQVVSLEPNREYDGNAQPELEQVDLAQTPRSELLSQLGSSLDVVEVTPTEENWERVRDLERVDYGVTNAHEGTMWALVLRADRGEFSWRNARRAFMRAVQRDQVVTPAAGQWRSVYQSTDSMLFAPGGEGYDIAQEDSGLRERIGGGADDAAQARDEIGVDSGARVCVLYDTADPFASAAYRALRSGVAEAGWDVRDCGTDDVDTAVQENTRWHAVLTRVPIPQTPAQIAAQWGSDGNSSLSGVQNTDRDELIGQLARAADNYEARDLRVQIETTIVDDAVAVPLVTQPTLAVSDRSIGGVQPRPGGTASLTSGIVDWKVGGGAG